LDEEIKNDVEAAPKFRIGLSDVMKGVYSSSFSRRKTEISEGVDGRM